MWLASDNKFLTTERDQLFEAFYADYRPDGWASLSGANLQPQSSGRPETAQAKSATHH